MRVEWKPIPKDKDGFFDERSNLYDELPIIVAETWYGEISELFYVDKESWFDYVADLSRPSVKYYLPCGELKGGKE